MGTGRLYDQYFFVNNDNGSATISCIKNGVLDTNNIILNNTYINDIKVDGNGVVWVGTECAYRTWSSGYNHSYPTTSKLYKIVGSEIIAAYDLSTTLSILSIAIDRNNIVHMLIIDYNNTNNVAIYKLSGSTFTQVVSLPSDNRLYIYPGNLSNIIFDKDNAIWITVPTAGNASYCNLLKYVNYQQTKSLDNIYPTSPILYCDRNNNVFLGLSPTNSTPIIKKITNGVEVEARGIGGTGYITSIIETTNYNGLHIMTSGESGNLYKYDTTKLGGIITEEYNSYIPNTVIRFWSRCQMSSDLDGDIWEINANDNKIYKITSTDIIDTGISITGAYTTRSKLTSGMEWYRLFPRRYLIQDGTVVKTFDGTAFSNIGSTPVTPSMFDAGMSSLANITSDVLSKLSSPKILLKRENNLDSNLKITGTPLPKLVLANSDILLSGTVSSLDKFTLTATNSGTSVMKIIMSFDSGTTWKAYNTSTSIWITVDKNTLSDVKSKGNTVAELNAITSGVWYDAILNADKKVRFGYYLEANDITDSVFTDLLTMQLDMNGSWKLCKLNTDYTYTYENSNGLKINLLNNGDYRVSVIS